MNAFEFWVKHSFYLNKRKEEPYKTSYKTYQIYNSNMQKKKIYDLSGKFIVIIIFIVIKTLEAHEKKHFVGKF